MASNTYGIGYFTTENIVAVIRALPETDGTYAEVVKRARDYNADVSRHSLGKWVSTGRRDQTNREPCQRLRAVCRSLRPAQDRALHGRRQPAEGIREGAADPGARLRVRQRKDGPARRYARRQLPTLPRARGTGAATKRRQTSDGPAKRLMTAARRGPAAMSGTKETSLTNGDAGRS